MLAARLKDSAALRAGPHFPHHAMLCGPGDTHRRRARQPNPWLAWPDYWGRAGQGITAWSSIRTCRDRSGQGPLLRLFGFWTSLVHLTFMSKSAQRRLGWVIPASGAEQ